MIRRKTIRAYTQTSDKDVDVADMWLKMLNPYSKDLNLNSFDSEYRLSHWDFALHIPDFCYEWVTPSQQIRRLFGYGELNSIPRKQDSYIDNAETLFHEMFHVFQTLTCRSVFDMFYLSSDIQQNRNSILTTLVDMYKGANLSIKFENHKTFFHHVQEKPSFVEKDKKQSGLGLGEILAKRVDLSKGSLKSLLQYKNDKYNNSCSTYELIEGSAAIFGLCCAGFKIDEEVLKERYGGDNLYTKAFTVFVNKGGDSPLLFIIFSLVSLKCGVVLDIDDMFGLPYPGDIFDWLLENLDVFQDSIFNYELNKLMNCESEVKKDINKAFDMAEIMASAKFRQRTNKSFYENDEDIKTNFFLSTINEINLMSYDFSNISFLMDIVLNQKIRDDIILIFNREKHRHAYNHTAHELERIIANMSNDDPDQAYPIFCCKKHFDAKNKTLMRVDSQKWVNCNENDSLRSRVLLNLDIELSINTFPDYQPFHDKD